MCKIPPRLEHSLGTLAEQLNQQLRVSVMAKAKTILSAHLSLIQDDEFAGNIRRLMTDSIRDWAAIISNMAAEFCGSFLLLASDYLRERVSDIRDISDSCWISPCWNRSRQQSGAGKTDHSGGGTQPSYF
ncbi:phosphoenolpyruvate-utilizing N-terminal domain-containing protein [Escherichia coli]